MKRTKEMKKEWIAELKKMQKSYQGEISPDDLPFDLTAELGEVVTVELKSPGVWSGRTSGLFWRFPCSFLYSKRVHCTA